jgi:two-component system chemotaxis response regulator CheB
LAVQQVLLIAASILKELSQEVKIPIVIILHRLKVQKTILEEYLQLQSHYTVKGQKIKNLKNRAYIYRSI